MSPLPEEFDIIVCGGGSTGCVVAGRLANLDHNLKVLLIEAGENNLNNPWVFRPGIFPRNMKLDSKTATFYESNPSPSLSGRGAIVPAANILGGGSSINFMMYTRASASDYDDFQAKGWSAEELLPFMKKFETYQRASHNRETHGFEGPIKVSFGNYQYPIKDDFLRAAESQGIPIVDDLQDLKTGHGAEQWLKWINRDTGRRSDAAHAYIHATRAVHSNLYLACNTKVDKVIIENGRAVAVQTVPTKPLGNSPGTRIFKARKQIVVSGGTMSSPLILQRSGIGDPAKLRAAGVKPIVDLPGVGLNFQDHYLTFSLYRAKPGVESFDDFARGDPATQKRVFEEWNLKGTGPLATNGIEAGVKIRPTLEELKEFESWPTPNFKEGWESYFKNKPDKPVMHYSVIAGWFGDHMLVPPGNYFTMFHFLEYPFSRGKTHITSPDPYAVPDFDAGFMSDPRDMVPMVWGYIKSRETARRMDAYAGECQSMHPVFDYDSEARAHDLNLADTNAYALPGNITAGIQHGSWSVPLPEPEDKLTPENIKRIVSSNRKDKRRELKYTKKDIQAIEEWVKRHVETTWHCLGTCSMAPREGNSIVKHGVLDERLNVHGVKGLKVADLSIAPDNVGANTFTVALTIGEKAAALVAEDLGYSGEALEMKVPDYHAPGENRLASRL
ncbi:Alternative oxidase, mitochondrial precursor [Podospora pseudocomata]|uniref:Alternative oxidase, mitochondrial n=2 Tax=Podospora TaxID=5144 RepID=A0ABR0GYL9_9PEZI|nr:Alternative oxidase, mitochondrial precursor [Podospora bellae-mahoneyi]KAK4660769.1 Alternative oxidase, mitochondrial precursor [Podospora pseudocomata]